jgi:hypothetical protein
MSDPKFAVYSDVKCVSASEQLAAIHGARVGIIGRNQQEDGSWEYVVSPNERHAFYRCAEAELAPIAPLNPIADDRSFATIRRALESCLHQDYERRYESVADALLDAVKSADHEKLCAEIEELERQPDSTVKEVFDSCDINVRDLANARELLVTVKTLAILQ